ncbi:MAG: M3 family metallopeptidase [Acidobacteria bacterium]|nr:M3 family metallopeptidase [Acidobacteriota bacterium]
MIDNPFFSEWTTPFGLPPFAAIQASHFLPAFEEGMRLERAEVAAIVEEAGDADFANTVEALERNGTFLRRVGDVFSNLNASHTNAELQAIARETAPLLARHRSAISLDPILFQRLDSVFDRRAELGLSAEAVRLVEKTHKRFVRAGARLEAAAKLRLAEIDSALASKTTLFEQNLLADTAAFTMVLAPEEDATGQGVVTLQRSSIEPFLQLSPHRHLREKAFRAWTARGDNGNEFDNKGLIGEIVALRRGRAQLLGYRNFALYSLDDKMAKTPEAARELLDKLWVPAVAAAGREATALQEAMDAEQPGQTLAAWDWRYFAEKVRQNRYEIDGEATKAYFSLEQMLAAVFSTAGRLFGLELRERTDLPRYHADVRTWEVWGARGEMVGVFYGDYYARPEKRSGAWMSSLRDQQRMMGRVTPVVTNNLNFNKPPAGKPTLLSHDDARTLFHEFGHALHGLLSDVTYPSLSGTNVPRDFVEMPSQLYEHWFEDKTVLERFARHYETGEAIPEAMLGKLKAAANFNQGFEMVEYLASAYVDLEWHLLEAAGEGKVTEREAGWLAELGMPEAILMRHRSTHFSHIFGSPMGYAAGYYSYRWSAVLDTDAFAAFEEVGDAFDATVAERLRRFIYSAGATQEPMALYEAFRGRAPETGALMRSLGFAAEG